MEKRQVFMKIRKVKFEIKSILVHMWWECKNRLSNRIHAYLFQFPSSNLSLSLLCWQISFSIFLTIQIHGYIFQWSSLYFNISLIYLSLSLSVSCISLVYLFQSQPLVVVRSSNLVHTISLIANNYFYLPNRKKIKNDTEKIHSMDRNREKCIRRLDWFWIDEGIEKVG